MLVAFALLGNEWLDVEVLVLSQESETVVVVHNISVTLNAIQVDVEGCISETEVAKFMEALFAVDELRELVRLRNAFVAERAVQILERSERNSGYIHVKVRRLQNLITTISVFKLMGQKRLRSNEEKLLL